MAAGPFDPGERARLSALWATGLLDTPPSQRFDRICRLAARVLEVPISLVSLVDVDRQWFKSRTGLTVEQTPREVSFCSVAVASSEDLLVVPDAAADPRFASNPLVTGPPEIRLYAGHVVRERSGHRLGTLCIIDRRPRELEEDELAVLADLARMVESEIVSLQQAVTDPATGLLTPEGLRRALGPALRGLGAGRWAGPVALVAVRPARGPALSSAVDATWERMRAAGALIGGWWDDETIVGLVAGSGPGPALPDLPGGAGRAVAAPVPAEPALGIAAVEHLVGLLDTVRAGTLRWLSPRA